MLMSILISCVLINIINLRKNDYEYQMSDIAISGILVKRNFNVSAVIRNVNYKLQSLTLIFRTEPVLELFVIHILPPLHPFNNVAAFLICFSELLSTVLAVLSTSM